MIDFINYYYDLYPTSINNIDDKYMFCVDIDKYYFVPYDRSMEELNELIELNKEMINSGSLVHEIVFNRFDNVINNYEGKMYILLKVYVNDMKKVDISDIIFMLNEGEALDVNKNISRVSWSKLWESKIDYLEYEMGHVINKYPILYSVIDYYIGLGENAILYLKDIVPSYNGRIMYGVSHRRIGVNSTLFDLYNPLNLIIDFKVRDIAEYIKDAFFNNYNAIYILDVVMSKYYFDKLNLSLFVCRLLFPSYFFDKFDEIVSGNKKENSIFKITKKSSDFEDFVSNFIKNNNLQTIGWIK